MTTEEQNSLRPLAENESLQTSAPPGRDISLSRNAFSAMDHARTHLTAALSAVRAASSDCGDTLGMVSLDYARDRITDVLRVLGQLRRRARVRE